MSNKLVHVSVVGPYMSGKTTLCNMLAAAGKGMLSNVNVNEDASVDLNSVCATIGCSSTIFDSNERRKFTVVDTPGLERFKCILFSSIRNTDVLLVCQRLRDLGKVDYLSRNSDSLRELLEYSGMVKKVIYVYTCSDEVGASDLPKAVAAEYLESAVRTSVFQRNTFQILFDILKIEVDRLASDSAGVEDSLKASKAPKGTGCC